MSSEPRSTVYTCDLCRSGPWEEHEVAEVRVEFWRPPRWVDTASRTQGSASFHACRACLESRRAPNPSIELENTVYIEHRDVTSLAMRVLSWFFPANVKQEPCQHRRDPLQNHGYGTDCLYGCGAEWVPGLPPAPGHWIEKRGS